MRASILHLAASVVGVFIAAHHSLAAQEVIKLDLQSSLPSTAPILGTEILEMTRTVAAISGGTLQLKFHEPGALVPPLAIFEAVASGAVDAGVATPAFWVGTVPAAPLFSAVPFGPNAGEYLAWIRHGGGGEIWDELLTSHGIHGIYCSIIVPEASGWFRTEITSIDDLKGLKMRILGLGANVMEKFGVATQLIAPGDIFSALQLGTIDAAEFSMPAADLGFGFYQIAKHYYFPGWHQPTTLAQLLINDAKWQSLSLTHKTQLEVACGHHLLRAFAAGEAAQFEALEAMQAKGVILHRWPDEILAAFEAAWQEVVAEQVAADKDFARAWESLSVFRKRYAVWRALSHMD